MTNKNIITPNCWYNVYKCTIYENNITKEKMVQGNRPLQGSNILKKQLH